jgi:hypothetical protein
MRYTRLGNTGLIVSRLSFGAMTFGSDPVSGCAMDSNFRTTALFILLVFTGCSRETPPTAATIGEIPGDLVIILERGVCFGTCPAYKLTITANGSVEFEGRHYVKKKGVVRATMSWDQLKQLVAEFEKAKYFTLKDRYVDEGDGCASVWTDQPYVTTSITIAGKTKSIKHYTGCQGPAVLKRLTALEDKIDEVVKSSQWFDKNNQ